MNRDQVRSAVLSELRSVPEFAGFVAATPVLGLAPRGDGHPVLVLPGWTADDRSTRPLRWYLRTLGYEAHGWGLGTNRGPDERSLTELRRRLGELDDGRGVSLVGWSLGGVYARLLAQRQASSVRLVVTLGSPIRSSAAAARALPVPSTSIYSRSDAVVPWRHSLDQAGDRSENIEVRGSHLGLGHNASALYVVADRLAQPRDRWRPFRPPAPLRALYPTPTR